MAVRITELPESRALNGPGSFVWKYTAVGSSVIDEIATALFNHPLCPPNYGFWRREWDKKSLVPVGGGVWSCEVPYGVGDIPFFSIPSLPAGSSGGTTGGGASGSSPPVVNDGDALGHEWSWDFGQTTRLMTKSLSTEGGYRRNLASEPGLSTAIPAKARGDAIGFNPETREVTGVEVRAGVQRMELQYKVPELTMGYVKKLRRLCSPNPHINSEAFLGQAAGEVCFVGMNIAWSQANGFTVRLMFDVGSTYNGFAVSEQLPTVDLKPWQYLDVTYDMVANPDGPSGALMKVPERYVVHNVLPSADLNDIFT